MALSTFLREAGYQQVALTRSAVGHFHTGGTLNGRRVDVLLDTRPRALLAMDLTHVNQSLALKGEAPVDVILGADVFEAQAAVIDYGSSSLFLKL